ncbi:hypothetical protein [Rhodoligotrophos defluvii]|uniref:hypothetical protein n=1 Tax=Rhodoligotrophos defluvii TaxID=2561934 RepID=UPI0010C9A367|nr:hypothetical protein [Rhodoligotrophos defluvii]
MEKKAKITTGPNDRPRDETIGQSGPGLPDDSSRPVEVDEAEIERARQALERNADGGARGVAVQSENVDAVPAGTPGSGENICRHCSGHGTINGRPCPECGGTGKITTPIGGA